MKKFTKKISEQVGKLVGLLKEGKVEEADNIKSEIDRLYMEVRNEREELRQYNESKNFGLTQHIFDEQLPHLFKTNKTAMKEYIATIKGDQNLLAESLFYNALKKYDGSDDAKQYVKECLELASKKINHYTVNESHRKIASVMVKYGITPDGKISDKQKKLFEDCNYLLTQKKGLTNITTISSKVKSVGDYIEENRCEPTSEEKKNMYNMIDEFNQKYKCSLTESEKEVLRILSDDKVGDAKKKAVFDKFQKECFNKLDKIIGESNEQDRESLKALMEEISSKQYNRRNVVRDVIKLIEVGDVIES